MREKHTSVRTAKPSIEAFALPSELRRTHNFASRARPIIGLDLPSTPPPLGAGAPSPANTPYPASARAHRRAAGLPHTDFAADGHSADADASFQPPALFRQTAPAAPPPRRPHWSERSTAGFLGFAVGLVIVVPLVFVIGANPGGPTTSIASTIELPSPAALLDKVRSSELFQALAPQPLGPRKAATPATTAAPPADIGNTQAGGAAIGADEPGSNDAVATDAIAAGAIADRALNAIAEGRLEEARNVLRAGATPENPQLWFLLAETYDPNIRRVGQPSGAADIDPADVEFARFYYRQSLAYGHAAASARLGALPRP